ncbi:hypothetical protein GCM10022251_25710 [Phytohabitans flavus]|uniref:Uncharacterized protein n=1 Tax=Phytohabitans flavus TaxID=1076124 RepID=A0A6F8XQX0_9ACTN|nr:hypothetical protein Pflav_026330 [Phytohabitans flavus]
MFDKLDRRGRSLVVVYQAAVIGALRMGVARCGAHTGPGHGAGWPTACVTCCARPPVGVLMRVLLPAFAASADPESRACYDRLTRRRQETRRLALRRVDVLHAVLRTRTNATKPADEPRLAP